MAARRDTGLVEVSDQRLGNFTRVDCPVGNLDGSVAVSFFITKLGHYVRLSLNHSHGNEVIVLVPYLGHAELRAHKSLNIILSFVPSSLITSISLCFYS